jgi:hypothetical protein
MVGGFPDAERRWLLKGKSAPFWQAHFHPKPPTEQTLFKIFD